jgi:putative transport protein
MLASSYDWFFKIFPTQSVSLTSFVVALVAATGLALGSLRLKAFSLGIPGVMFTGLLFGKLIGLQNLSGPMINFTRDFGLILFVYAVGVQVGPGFLASLRRRGLPLNLMAFAIVLLGAALSIGLAKVTGLDIKAAVGLFAGGTTNAPAYGSAEEALKSIHPNVIPPATAPAVAGTAPANVEPVPGAGMIQGKFEAERIIAPAFAIAYPFGLLGVILAMIFLRIVFRADPQAEAQSAEAQERESVKALAVANIDVENPNLDNIALKDFPAIDKTSIVVSRIHHDGVVQVPMPENIIHKGDVLLVVGDPREVKEFQLIVGKPSAMDLRSLSSSLTTRQILVTKREVLGKTVDELDTVRRYGVAVTRVSRAGLEFTALRNLTLQFGDRIRAVGEARDLDAAAKILGDSARELNLPRLLPIFVGILLGVFLGSIPVFIPGLPAPVRLGLASGPLIVSIFLARLGRVGSLIYFMPTSASSMLKDLGIVMFLIGVGINGGEGFFEKVATAEGLKLLVLGAIITIVPLLLVGLFARITLKANYLHICGLLCGSMTSPSLAFTHTMTPSEAPAVAFATVYPLTMISRVLIAQILILAFVG